MASPSSSSTPSNNNFSLSQALQIYHRPTSHKLEGFKPPTTYCGSCSSQFSWEAMDYLALSIEETLLLPRLFCKTHKIELMTYDLEKTFVSRAICLHQSQRNYLPPFMVYKPPNRSGTPFKQNFHPPLVLELPL